MNPVVYVPGPVADAIGTVDLQGMADWLAKRLRSDVDVLTYGPSKFHGAKRITGRAPQ